MFGFRAAIAMQTGFLGFVACAAGCGQSNESSAEPKHTRAVDAGAHLNRADVLRRLAEDEQLSDLRLLLQLNSFDDAESIAGLGSSVDDSALLAAHPKLRDTAFVDKVATIEMDDGKRIVAVAHASKVVMTFEYSSDVVFCFGEHGDVLCKIGGTFTDDGVNGYQIRVMTLGTTNEWFVIASRYQQELGFEMATTVFSLEMNPRVLLRVLHRGNDIAPTFSPGQAAEDGPGLVFLPLPEEYETDAQGRIKPLTDTPRIVWDTQAQRFRGRSRANQGRTPAYSVDTAASTAFEAEP